MEKKQSQELSADALTLSPALLGAWEKTVRERTRPPRGKDVKDLSRAAFVRLIAKSEAQNVKALWEAFTVNRQELARYLLDPKKQTAAYLMGFHLPNAARLTGVLTRLEERGGRFAKDQNYQLLDVGCGTGALSQTMAATLLAQGVPPANIKVALIDNKRAFLDAATANIKNLHDKISISAHKWELQKGFHWQPEPGDVVVGLLGYVWNELHRSRAAQVGLFEEFTRISKSNPLLLFVLEPGNQELARSAMELRDRLVDTGLYPLYPCPHSKSCPMLALKKDWCYSEFTWDRPPIVRDLDKYTGIEHRRISGSAYAFSTSNLGAAQAIDHVIVGRPLLKEKKGFEYLLCEKTGKLAKAKGSRGIPRSRGTLHSTAGK